jgi:hypothetical protein
MSLHKTRQNKMNYMSFETERAIGSIISSFKLLERGLFSIKLAKWAPKGLVCGSVHWSEIRIQQIPEFSLEE